MTATFADSYYWFALCNPRDKAHAQAVAFSRSSRVPLVTTAWVLTELADGFAKVPNRTTFLRLRAAMSRDTSLTIVAPTQLLLDRGLDLYAARPDKDWSLTDCISFVVMTDRGLTDALTADHHFAQAGFRPLLV